MRNTNATIKTLKCELKKAQDEDINTLKLELKRELNEKIDEDFKKKVENKIEEKMDELRSRTFREIIPLMGIFVAVFAIISTIPLIVGSVDASDRIFPATATVIAKLMELLLQ